MFFEAFKTQKHVKEETMNLRKVNIGILGIGNVGTGTVQALEMNRAAIEKSTRREIRVKKILARDLGDKLMSDSENRYKFYLKSGPF